MTLAVASHPSAPPSEHDLARWIAADRDARPARLARLRDRLERAGIDAYFGVRRENSRYLTGFVLADGEEKVAGNSGQFLVFPDEVVVFADSRYTEQAAEECPDARVAPVYHDLPSRWPELVGGGRRVAVEAGFVPKATWDRLVAAAPDVELVAVEGWIEARPGNEGTGRDRTHRGGLRRRRRGAGAPPADDPAGADGGRAGPCPGVGDAHPRGRGPRVRRRGARRAAGCAARTARPAGARCRSARCCSSTSGRRWRAIAAT